MIRALQQEDCQAISDAFEAQGWDKPVAQYERYLSYQAAGMRDVLVAEVKGKFTGYLTIKWESDYMPFKEAKIPEIVDFNVLQRFQRRGIGTALMDEAELRIKSRSPYAGIGFGVTPDYGAAQILYVKRGYVPDGRGLVSGARSVAYGEQVEINDELALYLVKEL